MPSFTARCGTFSGAGETWRGHFINRRKDGRLFEEEATISPVRDAAGKVVNYVAVKRDVTREMQLRGAIPPVAEDGGLRPVGRRRGA